jgi:hypothetical protein
VTHPGALVRRPRPRSRSEWLELTGAWLVVAAVLAAVVVLVLQRSGRPYLPVQDQAVLDMRVRDVWTFSANTPLSGPYSRFGWDHPGPLMYYALALFSGIMGEAPWATMVGNALVQAAAIAWLCRLAYKTGGLRRELAWPP